jgi:hypothetical protein
MIDTRAMNLEELDDSNLTQLTLYDGGYIILSHNDMASCQMTPGDGYAILGTYSGNTIKISTDFQCPMCLFRHLKGNDIPCRDCYMRGIDADGNFREESNG